MQKRSYTWSKAEMFIHVTVQNGHFLINYVIICKDIRSSSTWNSLFQHHVLTSVMACREHCILVQQKLDIFVPSLIVSYINQLDLSSCLKLVSLHISIVCIFIQFVLPMSRFSILVWCRGILSPGVLVVLYIPVTVVLSIGYGGLAPMHIWLPDGAKLCGSLVWPTYIRIFSIL